MVYVDGAELLLDLGLPAAIIGRFSSAVCSPFASHSFTANVVIVKRLTSTILSRVYVG